jgi:L-lactate dehydrogenase complex protein LldG
MHGISQDRFIARLTAVLGHPSDRSPRAKQLFGEPAGPDLYKRLDQIRQRDAGQQRQLLERLIEVAQPLNLQVTLQPDLPAAASAIVRLVQNHESEWGPEKSVVAWRHPLVAGLNLEPALAAIGVPLAYSELACDGPSPKEIREAIRDEILHALVGITAAEFCLADTATLVFRTRPGQARSVAIAPCIHVALIRQDQLIWDLGELFTLICSESGDRRPTLTNYMALTSGVSASRDIEGVPVSPASGPGQVHVFVLPLQGVPEYWSAGVMKKTSNLYPLLQHSSTPASTF